jgi:hypothetical protein
VVVGAAGTPGAVAAGSAVTVQEIGCVIVTDGLLPVIETTALKDRFWAKAGLIVNSEVASFQVNPG